MFFKNQSRRRRFQKRRAERSNVYKRAHMVIDNRLDTGSWNKIIYDMAEMVFFFLSNPVSSPTRQHRVNIYIYMHVRQQYQLPAACELCGFLAEFQLFWTFRKDEKNPVRSKYSRIFTI